MGHMNRYRVDLEISTWATNPVQAATTAAKGQVLATIAQRLQVLAATGMDELPTGMLVGSEPGELPIWRCMISIGEGD